MAQIGNPNALATLLRLSGPSNVRALPSNRALDVAAGTDWMEPSEGQLKTAQRTPGIGRMDSGPYTSFRSRDSLRDDAMSALRQQLGLGQIEHERELTTRTAPTHIQGQYNREALEREAEIAAQEAETQHGRNLERDSAAGEQRAALAREQQNAIFDRMEAEQDRITDRSQGTRASIEQLQRERLQGQESGLPALWRMLRRSLGAGDEAPVTPETPAAMPTNRVGRYVIEQ